MIEWGLLILIAIIAVAFAISLIPDGPDDALARFRQECRQQGMNFEETQAAISLRVGLVQLRRLASDRCIERNGNMQRKEINELAGNIAIGIAAAHGTQAAKSFVAWVDSCADEEILYDDARAARHRMHVTYLRSNGLYPPTRAPMSRDLRDAFKIV
ncbi:MAG: hypothetical protein E5Y34_06565 [Mesorhizobium sp.]|uniref:hypothetical protein n=1 Tax=Mesorhizobium sp. TaxID=1871066 RepID=UPI00121C6A1F|nr:hypothetical protein [Mesorhizobium sp.]TIN02687.1 MAG: hypothetical protein E5Y34_06565 [Mesorhizobium sp.]